VKAYDATFATDDVVVYLAAAGAGKTHAMMEEMAELLKVYRPDEIAFVTFTRKGVLNGIERAIKADPRRPAVLPDPARDVLPRVWAQAQEHHRAPGHRQVQQAVGLQREPRTLL